MDILREKDYIVPLMFTMYINAEIRRETGKVRYGDASAVQAP